MWSAILVLAIFYACVGPLGAESVKSYDEYKVYDMVLDADWKVKIANGFDGVEGYEFWQPPVYNFAHIMVAPQLQKRFELAMNESDIKLYYLDRDVGKSIRDELDRSAAQQLSRRSLDDSFGEFDFTYFPKLHEINAFVKDLVKGRNYSKLVSIGKSYEGRDILGVEVARDPSKQTFVIDAGIHAREWASHVGAMYIARKIVENEERYARKMNFVIIPCLNPDGYAYTHETDRLWRKSRAKLLDSSTECRGVDLNRNFGAHWTALSKREKMPCDSSYGGPKPFSEPESRALRDTILKHKPAAYLTIHSYGPLLMYPWGFSRELPDNWQVLDEIARQATEKMNSMHASKYKYGSSGRILYEAAGGSDDWAMEKAGVPIVYTLELPQYDRGMFIVPTEKIVPMVQELYEGFKIILDNIAW